MIVLLSVPACLNVTSITVRTQLTTLAERYCYTVVITHSAVNMEVRVFPANGAPAPGPHHLPQPLPSVCHFEQVVVDRKNQGWLCLHCV